MNIRFFLSFPLLGAVLCSPSWGRPFNIPSAVSSLVQRADPEADIEYCGRVSTNCVDYYLFVLSQQQLTGVVLVRQPAGNAPAIEEADTSLYSSHDVEQHSAAQPLREAIEVLLRKRNLSINRRSGREASNQSPEISSIGRDIDRILYPISGFRLEADSTREILRLLRTGPTLSVDPKKAPPGSIIVSPTQFYHLGPIYFGHAGILGSD